MFMRFCGFGPGHQVMRSVMKVFRDEIKLAFFGSTQNDEGEGTNLDEEGQQAQGDVEGDPEDDLDGEDDDDSEEEQDTEGMGDTTLDDDFDYAPL
jgi:hypothetical protein